MSLGGEWRMEWPIEIGPSVPEEIRHLWRYLGGIMVKVAVITTVE